MIRRGQGHRVRISSSYRCGGSHGKRSGKRRSLTVRIGRMIRRAIRVTLSAERVSADCEVEVQLTDDEGILGINREQRGLDRVTDVLSFPQLSIKPGTAASILTAERVGLPVQAADPETGRVFLGDIVLSVERARAQGREYGHSAVREAAYLTVHSTLHLLGYDHADESVDKRQMRAREKEIMALLKARWIE